MAYAEGYKGFHLGFAPRVVRRASYLRDNPQLSHTLLAPLFCMGYFYTTTRRQIVSIGLTVMIICFVLIAGLLPQPWRGIVDAGVVVGLSLGVASILYFLAIAEKKPAVMFRLQTLLWTLVAFPHIWRLCAKQARFGFWTKRLTRDFSDTLRISGSPMPT